MINIYSKTLLCLALSFVFACGSDADSQERSPSSSPSEQAPYCEVDIPQVFDIQFDVKALEKTLSERSTEEQLRILDSDLDLFVIKNRSSKKRWDFEWRGADLPPKLEIGFLKLQLELISSTGLASVNGIFMAPGFVLDKTEIKSDTIILKEGAAQHTIVHEYLHYLINENNENIFSHTLIRNLTIKLIKNIEELAANAERIEKTTADFDLDDFDPKTDTFPPEAMLLFEKMIELIFESIRTQVLIAIQPMEEAYVEFILLKASQECGLELGKSRLESKKYAHFNIKKTSKNIEAVVKNLSQVQKSLESAEMKSVFDTIPELSEMFKSLEKDSIDWMEQIGKDLKIFTQLFNELD